MSVSILGEHGAAGGDSDSGNFSSESALAKPSISTADSNWRVLSGDFIAVNAFLISCRCAKSPRGPAPAAHLGDGCLDLITVNRCSRRSFLRYLVHLTDRKKDCCPEHLKLPFVNAHRVRAFTFQALDRNGLPISAESARSDSSVWCVDGEILCRPNITCW